MATRHWRVAIIGSLGDDMDRLHKAIEAMRAEERAGNEILEVPSIDRPSSIIDLGTMQKRPTAGWYDFLQPKFLATIDAIIIADVDWVEVDSALQTVTLNAEDVYRTLRGRLGYRGPIFPATTNWTMNDRLQTQGSQPVLHWESFHGLIVSEIQKRR